MTRNSNLHFEVLVDGEFVKGETCRNSLGGFENLHTRTETLVGSKLRSSDGGETWTTTDGRTVTFRPVQTF